MLEGLSSSSPSYSPFENDVPFPSFYIPLDGIPLTESIAFDHQTIKAAEYSELVFNDEYFRKNQCFLSSYFENQVPLEDWSSTPQQDFQDLEQSSDFDLYDETSSIEQDDSTVQSATSASLEQMVFPQKEINQVNPFITSCKDSNSKFGNARQRWTSEQNQTDEQINPSQKVNKPILARRWTKEEKTKLLLWRAKKESWKTIGDELGRTPCSAKHFFKRYIKKHKNKSESTHCLQSKEEGLKKTL